MEGVLARVSARLERFFALEVLAAGALGLVAPAPGRWLVAHRAIPILLAVLVFLSAVAIQPGILSRLGRRLPRLALAQGLATVLGLTAAWIVSHLVADADLSHGLLALGVAPAEIATVAMAGLAGGDAAIAAALLVGSTAVTVAIAGPVLTLLAGSGVDTRGTVVELGVVVGIPLALGLLLPRLGRRSPLLERVVPPGSIGLVLVLVALVASQIHPSRAYLGVTAAIVAFVALTTAGAVAISTLVDTPSRPAVVLSVAVRDFAVASGIAEAAFGAKASGPLGIYGVVVIASGAALVRWLKPPDSPVQAAGGDGPPGSHSSVPPRPDPC